MRQFSFFSRVKEIAHAFLRATKEYRPLFYSRQENIALFPFFRDLYSPLFPTFVGALSILLYDESTAYHFIFSEPSPIPRLASIYYRFLSAFYQKSFSSFQLFLFLKFSFSFIALGPRTEDLLAEIRNKKENENRENRRLKTL